MPNSDVKKYVFRYGTSPTFCKLSTDSLSYFVTLFSLPALGGNTHLRPMLAALVIVMPAMDIGVVEVVPLLAFEDVAELLLLLFTLLPMILLLLPLLLVELLPPLLLLLLLLVELFPR